MLPTTVECPHCNTAFHGAVLHCIKCGASFYTFERDGECTRLELRYGKDVYTFYLQELLDDQPPRFLEVPSGLDANYLAGKDDRARRLRASMLSAMRTGSFANVEVGDETVSALRFRTVKP